MKKGTTIGTALLLGASLVMVACSSGSNNGADASEGDPPKEELVVVQKADVASLSTNIASQRTSSRVAGEIVEAAVKIRFNGPDLVLEPALAESWEQLDEHTWQFNVREGVKFTNGEELTAENWETSLAQLREDPAGKHSSLRNIEIDVIDDLTFHVITEEPNLGPLPAQMTWFPVMPTDYRNSVSDAEFGEAPIGTGPYLLEKWTKGVSLDLVANPDYWGDVPEIKKISILTVEDDATRVSMLESGAADLAADLSPEMTSRVSEMDGVTVKWGASDSRSMLVLNTNTPPTDDLLVRQAINYAIDKQAMVDSLFQGHAAPIEGVTVEGEMGFDRDFAPYAYDPDKAEALLAEAGYPEGGLPIDFNYTIGTSLQDDKVAEAIQDMLEKVGFDVSMKGGPFATLQPKWREPGATSGMYTMSFSPVYPDISFLYRAYFHPDAVYGPIWTREVEELTEISEEALTTAEPEKRAELYRDAQQIVMEEALWVPLFNYQNGYAMVNDLDWDPVPDNRFYFEYANFS